MRKVNGLQISAEEEDEGRKGVRCKSQRARGLEGDGEGLLGSDLWLIQASGAIRVSSSRLCLRETTFRLWV